MGADEADIAGWASSGSTDRVALYAGRGRQHQHITDIKLNATWVLAFERLANDFANSKLREEEGDLKSEMTLRKMEPPYEQVKEALEQYIEKTTKLLKAIEKNDPTKYRELNADMEADISQFKSDRDRPQN